MILDVDECLNLGICGNGTCVNEIGNYSCLCNYGYTGRVCLTKGILIYVVWLILYRVRINKLNNDNFHHIIYFIFISIFGIYSLDMILLYMK